MSQKCVAPVNAPVDRSHALLRHDPPQQDPKRVRFCSLDDINVAQQGTVNTIPNPDFRGGGSPTERLPPHLMGEYIGRQNTRQVLRVFE